MLYKYIKLMAVFEQHWLPVSSELQLFLPAVRLCCIRITQLLAVAWLATSQLHNELDHCDSAV